MERLVGLRETVALAQSSLGAILWLEGNSDDPISHTQKAWEMDPTWSMWPTISLGWIDLAISKLPETIECYETRGFVLMKMVRWDEALVDLERVLPHRTGEQRKVAYERLAAIDKALGQDRIAAVHEAEAPRHHPLSRFSMLELPPKFHP